MKNTTPRTLALGCLGSRPATSWEIPSEARSFPWPGVSRSLHRTLFVAACLREGSFWDRNRSAPVRAEGCSLAEVMEVDCEVCVARVVSWDCGGFSPSYSNGGQRRLVV